MTCLPLACPSAPPRIASSACSATSWATASSARGATAKVTLSGNFERRPDLVLYLNGIAIGVIEAKYFLAWKEDEQDNTRSKLDKYLRKICEKRRLLELIHDFVVFDGGVKKLPRVHQYFGVKAAQARVRDRKGGIIWHTQGSGKSIVMVLLANWILENNPNARVAIAVYNSEDLDYSAGGADPQVLMEDRLTKGRERLDDALEVLAVLCDPVQPPKGELEHIHYFCGNTELPEDLKERAPRRAALYKATVALLRAYANIADEAGSGRLQRRRDRAHQAPTGSLRGRPRDRSPGQRRDARPQAVRSRPAFPDRSVHRRRCTPQDLILTDSKNVHLSVYPPNGHVRISGPPRG